MLYLVIVLVESCQFIARGVNKVLVCFLKVKCGLFQIKSFSINLVL